MSNVVSIRENSGAKKCPIEWNETSIEHLLKDLNIRDYELSSSSRTIKFNNHRNLTRVFIHLNGCECTHPRYTVSVRRSSDRIALVLEDSWRFEALLQNELIAC